MTNATLSARLDSIFARAAAAGIAISIRIAPADRIASILEIDPAQAPILGPGDRIAAAAELEGSHSIGLGADPEAAIRALEARLEFAF